MSRRATDRLAGGVPLSYDLSLPLVEGLEDEPGELCLGIGQFRKAWARVWEALPEAIRRLLRHRVRVVLEGGPLRVVGDRERALGGCSVTGLLSFRWPRARQLPAERLHGLIAHELAHRALYVWPGTRILWGKEHLVEALQASWGFPKRGRTCPVPAPKPDVGHRAAG